MIPDLEKLTKKLTPEQQKQLEEDGPYLEQFIAQGNVLLRITADDEYFPPEGLMYYFDDNLGGYSIKGVKNSLTDKQEVKPKSNID